MSTPSGSYDQPLGQPTVLAGRYLLEGKIAAGGMGEVWRAVDQTLGRPVAVKLLRPEYAADESFLVRFRGEARHAARLSHPGVASVYDYGEVRAANGRPTAYLVMELVEGEPLSALLHRERRVDPSRTLDILGQAATALQAAHDQGVVHRDVKPGNLLVRNDGVVKVTDFGIARAMDAAPLTATGIMMGTAYYVSPEQASGKTVTPASDVYSLGVVAYECLAGRRPFDDRNPIVVVLAHQQDNPPPLPPDVPNPVRALVESAMEKQPSRRPPSADDFARQANAIRANLLWEDGATRHAGAPLGRPGDAGHAPAPRTGSSRTGSSRTGSARTGSGAGTGIGGALVPSPGRSPATRGPAGGHGGQGQSVAPWDRDWGPVGTASTGGYPPVEPTDTRGLPIGDHPGFGYDDPTAYGGPAGDLLPMRSGGPGRERGQMPLALLVALLVATVIVSALITRTIAGSSSSNSGAAAVHLTPAAGPLFEPVVSARQDGGSATAVGSRARAGSEHGAGGE